MSQFGPTLFGGSRFVRWTLTPFVLIFAVFMPLVVENWTPAAMAITAGMELACAALLAGFWLPARLGQWAFRGLAALVFVAYAAYVVDEFFFTEAASRGSRGGASPLRSLLGFFVIGIPSLWYAIKGRFTLRPELSPEQMMGERAAHDERLLRPDWSFYEKHLQRPVPAALRELYSNRALLTGEIEWPDDVGINSFEPLDEQGLLDSHEQLGLDAVAFATSDCGDPIYLRPGATEPNTVYITYHDGGDTEVFAESVAALLNRLTKGRSEK